MPGLHSGFWAEWTRSFDLTGIVGYRAQMHRSVPVYAPAIQITSVSWGSVVAYGFTTAHTLPTFWPVASPGTLSLANRYNGIPL